MDSLYIVQFPHPGNEHGPDTVRDDIKSWNRCVDKKTGKPIQHARKFMLAPDAYVEHEKCCEGELLFWGEWEPPSRVRQLNRTAVQERELYPQYLHEPFLPSPLPQVQSPGRKDRIPPSGCGTGELQNTDPFVFGDTFRYALCKQSKRDGTLNKTARLGKGSLILFGTGKGTGEN
jgi:hypothetical protein